MSNVVPRQGGRARGMTINQVQSEPGFGQRLTPVPQSPGFSHRHGLREQMFGLQLEGTHIVRGRGRAITTFGQQNSAIPGEVGQNSNILSGTTLRNYSIVPGGTGLYCNVRTDNMNSFMACHCTSNKSESSMNDNLSADKEMACEKTPLTIENICMPVDYVNSKTGFSGVPIQVTGNMFVLNCQTCFYQYRVSFDPVQNHVATKKNLLKVHKNILGCYLFNGETLFTNKRNFSCPLELYSTMDSSHVCMTLNFVSVIKEGDHVLIKLFNIILKQCFKLLQMRKIGNQFYDADKKVFINEHKLELWSGYAINIKQHKNKILMKTEIANRIISMETVLNLWYEYLNQSERNHKEIFKSKVVGSMVLTEYNDHIYIVKGVDFDVTPLSTFSYLSDSKISYVEYYHQKYHVTVGNLTQPLLVAQPMLKSKHANSSEFVYLIPELCKLVGLTRKMKENFHLVQSLFLHTNTESSLRINKLLTLSQKLLEEKNVQDILTEWQVSVDHKLLEFRGRVLGAEKIVQGKNTPHLVSPDANFRNNVVSNSVLLDCKLKKWVVMHPLKEIDVVKDFVNSLITAAMNMQFEVAQPTFYGIPDDRPWTYSKYLQKVITDKYPQLILCAVSTKRKDCYTVVKQKCCVENTIPTQVVVTKNLLSKSIAKAIAKNIAVQIICKIGGAPWTIDIPLTDFAVIGFYACHDSLDKNKNYGAMVTSLNKTMNSYYSVVSSHTNNEELSHNLLSNVTNALDAYKKHNGTLPMKLIVYRGIVNEKDIPNILKYEVEPLKNKLSQIFGNPANMAFILVNDHVNISLFMENGNVPPGTVVDDTITLPNRHDFYLTSQSSDVSSSYPTYYYVISDNAGLDQDKLQRFTYKMMHLYYNQMKVIRVPAPLQYARKLALLTGHTLHQQPKLSWDNRLYYL